MGLIANAVSQLLGFGLEQADGFIDRKIQEGKLAEAATATRRLLEESENRLVTIAQDEGLGELARTGADKFNAFEEFARTSGDPNQVRDAIASLKESGAFGQMQRILDTRDKRVQGADKATFGLVGQGIDTQRGTQIAKPLGLDSSAIREQQVGREREKRKFETQERVRETELESGIPGRVSRGGGKAGGSARTKMGVSSIKETLLGDPRFTEEQSELERLEGKPKKLNKLGTQTLVDIQTRKTFDSQKEGLSQLGVNLGLDGESQEVSPAQEKVNNLSTETDTKVEETLYKTQQEADTNLSAMASVLNNSSDEKLNTSIERAERIFKKAGKASKKAMAEFQRILTKAKQRRKKHTKR